MYLKRLTLADETSYHLQYKVLPFLLQELVEPFGIKACILQLGASKVAISKMKAKHGSPSAADLQRVYQNHVVQRLLQLLEIHDVPERGAILLSDSLYFRILEPENVRKKSSVAFRHTTRDSKFYASTLRPHCDFPTTRCFFCTGPARRETCQRCFGGGLRTMCIPLHDVDPRRHPTTAFRHARHGLIKQGIKVGQAWWFDGGTEYCDAAYPCREKARRRRMPRFSLDVRFLLNTLPRLTLVPGAHAPLRAALQLLLVDRQLWKREMCNYAYLFQLLERVEGGAYGVFELCDELMDARWLRKRAVKAVVISMVVEKEEEEEKGWDGEEGKQPPLRAYESIEEAMDDWMTGPRPPRDALLDMLSQVERECEERGPLCTTKRGGYVRCDEMRRVLMVTHAVFMATDYLLRPARWTKYSSHVIEAWLVDAYGRLDPFKNLEVWVEVAMCCSKIIPGFGMVHLPAWSAELEEDLAPKVAKRYRRFKNDVRLHMRWLLAWAYCLQ